MTTYLKVARYHLVQRFNYLIFGFFRVPYLLDGQWYLTFLLAVLLAVLLAGGFATMRRLTV